MSERFGIPDHAPQHAPDHALQNPTPQGSWGSAPDWSHPSGTTSNYGGSAVYTGPVITLRKSLVLAIILATLLGPLGLFYISFLNGVAALVILPLVVRSLAYAITARLGGDMEIMRTIAIPLLWCFSVPWSIIGTRWRNRKIDRLAGR
jgi:hypothetical protein